MVKNSTSLAYSKYAFRHSCRVLEEGREDVIGVLGEDPNGVNEAHELGLQHHISHLLFGIGCIEGEAMLVVRVSLDAAGKQHHLLG